MEAFLSECRIYLLLFSVVEGQLVSLSLLFSVIECHLVSFGWVPTTYPLAHTIYDLPLPLVTYQRRFRIRQRTYRRRLWRGIAASPSNFPEQSAPYVWASLPSQGSAGRVQDDNNCNGFRRELDWLRQLSKRCAATNADVHEQRDPHIVFLWFCYDLGHTRGSWKQFRSVNSTWPQTVAPWVSFSRG